MINKTLYLREIKKSIKLLIFFIAVITMYVAIIVTMYEPETMESLQHFNDIMPGIMAAVGMDKGMTNLLGFMVSYLYGFILLVFPMVYSIVRANGLVAKYSDTGSMAVLLSPPVKRIRIILTQAAVLITGITFLVIYATVLEIVVAAAKFPGELNIAILLKLNLALLFLQLFLSGVCFMSSCVFQESKYSIAVGAGLPGLMYILQMLANVGEKAEFAKYFTCFTLFEAKGIAIQESGAFSLSLWLLVGAVVLYVTGCTVFCRKDISV